MTYRLTAEGAVVPAIRCRRDPPPTGLEAPAACSGRPELHGRNRPQWRQPLAVHTAPPRVLFGFLLWADA
jgi:hypothetical protein